MSSLRYAELFAGAGGLSMGLERAGWSCAFHAEIADAPRAVLAQRWADVPLYGDVTAIDGRDAVAKHGAVDLLTGGSPCQDLSVAGKRAGLEGSRSSLFFELMRLWGETGADLCLWENVDGARSSNNGRDFGEVLRAFVGAAVPVPSDGWRSAGVAAGPAGVAAWRVLDAQFFGVPQRRRRVFVLGTRTGRVDPAEVLSLAEGVCRDSEESGETREGAAADATRGIAIPLLEVGKRTGVSTTDTRVGSGIGDAGDPMFTLQRGAQHGVFSFDWQKGNDVTNKRPSTMNVVEEATNTLCGSRVPAVFSFDLAQITHPENRASVRTDAPCSTLNQKGQVHVAFNETGHESWREETIAGSLNAHEAREAREAHTIVADHEIASTLNGTQRQQVDGAMTAQHGLPRRLTPRECERLMGWPDDHTLVEFRDKQMSDSARYKMCGNGVASPVAQWIGWRLALALCPPPSRDDPSDE